MAPGGGKAPQWERGRGIPLIGEGTTFDDAERKFHSRIEQTTEGRSNRGKWNRGISRNAAREKRERGGTHKESKQKRGGEREKWVVPPSSTGERRYCNFKRRQQKSWDETEAAGSRSHQGQES